MSNVDGKTVDHYVKNQDAVNKARPITDVTEDFLSFMDNIGKKHSQDSTEAFDILKSSGQSVEPAVFSNPIRQAADNLKQGGAYGPSKRRAIQMLEGFADAVDGEGGPISLDKGKSLLFELDDELNKLTKDGGNYTQIKKAMSDARKGIDTYLKGKVPKYGDHMEDLARETETIKELSRRFNTPKGAENKLRSIMRGKDSYTQKQLEAIDQEFGANFTQELKDSHVKNLLSQDSTHGSRKTLLGALAGGMSGGGPAGMAIGGAIGAAADKFAAPVYKKLIDGTLNLGKWSKPLIQEFETKGPKAFTVMYHLLKEKGEISE